MPRRPPLTFTEVAALTALLAGCGGANHSPVAVPPPSPTPSAATLCDRLVQALPATIADSYDRRPTSPASHLTAAWGDPAVTLRCGTPPPARPYAGSEFTVNGVDWLVMQNGGAVEWQTLGRPVTVEVQVPATYNDQDAMLYDISGPLGTVVPAGPTPSPTGSRR